MIGASCPAVAPASSRSEHARMEVIHYADDCEKMLSTNPSKLHTGSLLGIQIHHEAFEVMSEEKRFLS
jgi:hypothetical protein